MPRGSADSSPGWGKHFDTIYYDVEQIAEDDRVITRKVEIKLYMKKQFEGEGKKKATRSIWLRAHCEEQDVSREGTDIHAVLEALRGDLDRRYKIKWERWLYVEVLPASLYDSAGKGLKLSWSDVERGVTLDGDVLMRRRRLRGDWYNQWEITPWPKEYKNQKGETLALIPETEENVAALEEFANKIDQLRKTLADFVSPDKIEKFLAAIVEGSSLKMLSYEDTNIETDSP